MNLYKHIVEQPFIFATGIAALVHSTWSLAVLFSGEPPTFEVTSFVSWAQWAYWLLPALLIAFAMDIGQISTSAQIRAGERTARKYATFIVLALFGYYLQWIYIAHHMPALELGAGVYNDGLAAKAVLLMRNAAVWIIPALLPLSTTLYTLSSEHTDESAPTVQIVTEQKPVKVPALTESAPVSLPDVTEQPAPQPRQEFNAVCPSCGWESGRTYETELQANRAIAAHRRTCSTIHPELYTNGHSNGYSK